MLSDSLNGGDAILISKKDDIESDYRRMRDFMLTGGKDPQLDTLYDDLLRRAYSLWCSIEICNRRSKKPHGAAATHDMTDYTARHDMAKERLEAFVQELALATLLPEEEQKKSADGIRVSHARYVASLFDDISTSGVWPDGLRRSTKELLLSPNVDTPDTLQLTSAITLSLLNVFDVNKWLTLTDVFQEAADERLRQRAFAGWALTLPDDDMTLFPEVSGTIERLCSDEQVRREIVELQIQLYYCDSAEADNAAIQKEILPALERNNKFRITRHGIEEKEDDELSDILNPGAEERKIEEVEKTINKMVEMQKAGSDIYYSGFSQMKRYPFFNEISNWFCPFYMENPALSKIEKQIQSMKILRLMLSAGTFCDSDKYSFVFATATIIDKMPDNLKEMLNNSEPAGIHGIKELNPDSPLYIRRMYLQDMYRFFRLNYRRNEFQSPFQTCDNGRATLFLSNPLLARYLKSPEIASLYKYLLKHQRYSEILLVNGNISSTPSRELDIIVAAAHLRCSHYDEAAGIYATVLSEEPENEPAMKGMAKASFIKGKYKEASALYKALSERNPANISYSLNNAISLIKCGETEDGMALLFKLEYQNPDDNRIKRAEAWGWLARGEAQKAAGIYSRLTAEESSASSDMLNCAYAEWALRHTKKAVDMFRKYLDATGNAPDIQMLRNEMEAEKDILGIYGISETERKIMSDMI